MKLVGQGRRSQACATLCHYANQKFNNIPACSCSSLSLSFSMRSPTSSANLRGNISGYKPARRICRNIVKNTSQGRAAKARTSFSLTFSVWISARLWIIGSHLNMAGIAKSSFLAHWLGSSPMSSLNFLSLHMASNCMPLHIWMRALHSCIAYFLHWLVPTQHAAPALHFQQLEPSLGTVCCLG